MLTYLPQVDGLEWLVDLVLGGLKQGQASAAEGKGGMKQGQASAGVLEERCFHWSLDVHSVVRGGGAACGPHVYVLRRTPRRASKRLRAQGGAQGGAKGEVGEGRGEGEEEVVEEELRMRHHLHEAE